MLIADPNHELLNTSVVAQHETHQLSFPLFLLCSRVAGTILLQR